MQAALSRLSRESITGVILAGGAARRLGGRDKGLMPFAGRPLVEWVIDAVKPQVGALLLSANRNIETYSAYGCPVVQDAEAGFQGPLAGILSAMRAAPSGWVLTVPCDGPRPPPDLAERLARAVCELDVELAVATDGKRPQSVYALLCVSLAENLAAYLAAGERKVERWHAQHQGALVDFSDRPDGFVNLNSADEALALEQIFLSHPDTFLHLPRSKAT